jgi:hypothetical protein
MTNQKANSKRRKNTSKSAKSHPAFGMWKDRKDMKDVAAYVRRLRRGRYDGL